MLTGSFILLVNSKYLGTVDERGGLVLYHDAHVFVVDDVNLAGCLTSVSVLEI